MQLFTGITLLCLLLVVAFVAMFGLKETAQIVLRPLHDWHMKNLVLSVTPACKAYLALAPTSATNGGTNSAQIDTLGFDYLELDIGATTANVVSNKPSVLKLSESDDTTTTVTDITKFVGGGTGGFTIPSADTSNAVLYKMRVDLRGRKRYLTLTISPRTTQTHWAHANLSKAEQTPNTATLAGATVLVEG